MLVVLRIMRTIVVTSVVTHAFFAMAHAKDATEQKLEDIVADAEQSVALIEVSGPNFKALGSGFVVSTDGLLATNHHVIEGAETAIVKFKGRKEFAVLGTVYLNPKKDIAILKVKLPEGEKLHPIPIAQAMPPKGKKVIAFGMPKGLSFSVSDGIVSASRTAEELEELIDESFEGTWIQTTAPISSGNSGGPLVDLDGKVVGMNTSSLFPGTSQNINLAISCLDLTEAVSAAKKQEPQELKPDGTNGSGDDDIDGLYAKLFRIADGQKDDCVTMLDDRITSLKETLTKARKVKNFVTKDGFRLIGVKSKGDWIKAFQKYIDEHEDALAQIRDDKRPPFMLTDLLDKKALEKFDLIDMRAIVRIEQIDDDGAVWAIPLSYMDAKEAPYNVILENFETEDTIRRGQITMMKGFGYLQKTGFTQGQSKGTAYRINYLGEKEGMVGQYAKFVSRVKKK